MVVLIIVFLLILVINIKGGKARKEDEGRRESETRVKGREEPVG